MDFEGCLLQQRERDGAEGEIRAKRKPRRRVARERGGHGVKQDAALKARSR
jgi:hypothetical protein